MSSPPKMSPNKFISGCGRGRGRGTALIKDAHATEFSPGATVAVAGTRRIAEREGATSGRPSKALFFLYLLSFYP